MNIIVQKFGGTSVANPDGRRRIGEKVAEAVNRGLSPVLVVSAMGRHPEPYATDSLLALVAPYAGHQDKRELDMLMACGESISVVLMSHYLRSLGYAAEAFDAYRAGIRTSDRHGDGAVLKIETDRMHECLERGGIPVVTGFQGVNSHLAVTTLGRGGSDTSAVAIGAALRAQVVEIYTDVDGVLTADPRVCEEAHILPEVSFEEMGELAGEGAKVVHPRAVDLAADYGLPVWIKNTFGNRWGTFLSPVAPRQAFEKTRVVTAVAHMTGLSQIMVDVSGSSDASKARVALLETLAERAVNLDLVNVCGDLMCFILRTETLDQLAVFQSLGYPYKVRSQCAKISIVGSGMRGTPGVAYRAHRCLDAAGIELYHSTDSHITISCLIPADKLSLALSAVHKEFQI